MAVISDQDIQWIKGVALTVVTFFIGWGLKDVKKRYDLVPGLETSLQVIKKELEDINRRLGELER